MSRYAIKKKFLHMKGPEGPKSSEHEIDFRTYTVTSENYTAWVTKLNKREGKKGVDASLLEVVFSEIALLFMRPDLTPLARIVVDDTIEEHVVGVASENFSVQIKKIIDSGKQCYSFNPAIWMYDAIPTEITPAVVAAKHVEYVEAGNRAITPKAFAKKVHLDEAKKAVNFLDKMPGNFFADLMAKHNTPNSGIIIDMESLASILSTSYVLEEDDLHKGNIGFYVTQVTVDGIEKKQFNFFKVDHDLMLSDGIMAQKNMRIANLFYHKGSFKISNRDLESFPDLKDSGNHYWPTKGRMLVAGHKAYKSKGEREAFVSLKDDPVFRDAKWKGFLKAAVIPIQLIEKSLTTHLDSVKDKDKMDMVRNAIWSRIGQVRRKLVESEEFRIYIHSEKGYEALSKIRIEISSYLEHAHISDAGKEPLMQQLEENFNVIRTCAGNISSRVHFTALQKSILLDGYKFSPKIKPTAIDVKMAIDRFRYYKKDISDPQSFKFACITEDLIQKSANPKQFQSVMKEIDALKMSYLEPLQIHSFEYFELAMGKVKASNLPLKQQKEQILMLLKNSQLRIDDLRLIKEDLQRTEPTIPSLKLINQLRSSLWLIRKIFGTYGKTATSTLMIKEIKVKIATLTGAKSSHDFRMKLIDIKTPSEIEINSNKDNKPPCNS